MAKKMLIDATHPEETRVVVVDGNKVDDFDFESINKRQLAGNIYLAKITRVEPSLQAAFVEYGGNRHGFLAFAEIHPDYYQIPVADREALLAEEMAEADERRRADEEGDNETKPAKSGRGRGRGRTKKDAKPARPRTPKPAKEDVGVAGLEVIDIDAEDTSPEADTGASAQADPLATIEPDLTDDRMVDSEFDVSQDAAPEKPETADVPVEEAPAEAVSSDTPADAEPDETPAPRTIAESAGLDDEDRVTGDIEPEGAERRTTKDSETDTSDTATVTEPEPAAHAEEAQTAEAVTEVAPADAGASPVEAAPDSEAEAKEAPPVAKPRRKRRSKADREKEAAEKAASDADAVKADAPSDGAEAHDGKAADAEDDDVRPDEPEQVGAEDTLEEAARARTKLRRRYKIQDVIKVRQIMLVQVVKEERGNKGAALTTYLSLAGRYCVLMPNTARGGGISRKITNAPDRKRLREITGGLEVPQGMGLIVRTAGAERTKAEIKRDYEFLIRQWEQIRELTLKSIAPTLIYEEGSLIKRSIRDIYNRDIDQILVEGETGYREAKEYMKMLMPSHAKNVQPYTESIPLFSRYQVESYLNGMFNPTVQLKSGGYIVIGITEALVAIDVNSGRATKQGSIEETALQTNLEAAEEVARQLRLRDLAGLIVIDFIDMDENRNNRAVEKRMKDRLKTDRARIQVGRISAFGLMEMSRQRLRPGMLEATTQMCSHCQGMGYVRSDENMALSMLRELEEEGVRNRANQVTLKVPVAIANYLINQKRANIAQIEERHGVNLTVLAEPGLTSPDFEIERSKTQTPRPSKAPIAITADSVVEEEDLVEEVEAPAHEEVSRDDEDGKSRRRRGKRGGRRKRAGEGDETHEAQDAQETQETADGDAPEGRAEEDGEDRPRSRRGRGRRRGGRGRRNGQGDDGAEATEAGSGAAEAQVSGDAPQSDPPAEPALTEATEETVAAAVTEDATVAEEAATEEAFAEEAVSEETPAATSDPAPEHVAEAETIPEVAAVEPVEEPVAQPAPEPALETVADATPEPDDPTKPRRRGWWSFGRN